MLQSHVNDDKVSRYLQADVDSFQFALHEYLRDEIAKIIRTDGSWSVGSILHQDVAKMMVNNVLWWLFDGEPEKSLNNLEQLNNPQHVCGRVFKSGEPTYSCRDCAMDPTCVFCQQCFWNSEHSKHRYKMHTSAGGGCCDCGDVEAWHQHHACRTHSHDSDQATDFNMDAVCRLPQKTRERAAKFFEVMLAYVVDFLTVEKTSLSEVVESLQPSEKSDSFVTMLFNDELHTFDFVIDILKKALNCNNALGADFATIVDREGRSPVCVGGEERCEEIKKIVGTKPTAFFSFRTSESLKTLVIHLNIVAHQEMALLILPWLSRIVQQSEGLRVIFCEVAMKEMIPPEVSTTRSRWMSAAEKFMRSDHKLWKAARNQYLQLLMNSLLLDAETKKNFGVLFTRLYEFVQEGFMDGDHDHSQSVTSLSVQLFTVPTVARHLIIHEDVIGVILRTLAKSWCDEDNISSDNWCRVVKIDTKKMKKAMRRPQYSFYDLRYILGILPDQWTEDLKLKFIEGVKLFIQILMAMQGMDSVKRRTDRHIEHDPDWETGVNISMKFHPIIHHMLKWFRTDIDLLFTVLQLCLQGLKVLNNLPPDTMKLGTTDYNGTTYPCIDFDISKQSVSTQYPVSRLLAAVLVDLGAAGVTWNDIERNEKLGPLLQEPSFANELMEYSLRCLCLSAQVNSGMWRRNGVSLINQLFYYKEYRCREETFERDIQLLQVCAANMEPNHFIAAILHKIKPNPEPPEFEEYRNSILGEFFRILISVCGERFVPGVAAVTPEEQTRRQIIHILAGEAKPHSKIAKQLPDSIPEKLAWEDILHEVADFQEPTSVSSVGRYVLKLSSFSEFCPFSYHYTSPTDETKAQQEIFRRKKSQQWPTVFVPPKLPQFTKLFSNVPNILCSDVFIHLMSNFLQQLTSGNHELWWDRLVEKALYLLAMAIVENEQQLEMNQESEFTFVRKAVSGCESSILFLLKQLQVTESISNHWEMISWLVAKIERMTNQRQSEPSSSSVDPERVTLRDDQDNARNTRKRKAQELRDKLLTQMKVMQQNFLSKNPDLVLEQPAETSMDMSQEPIQATENPICTELSWQLQALKMAEPTYTCILCQEDSSSEEGDIVMSALVQRSTVLTRGPRVVPDIEQFSPLFADVSLPNGIHTSTCSHAMHFDCFTKFRESVNNTEARRRHNRYSRRSFDVTANEFLCPLCSRISNTVMPVIPLSLVAKQRGILIAENIENSKKATASSSVDKDDPSMKAWLKAIEEMLKPVKHEAQEVVLKFHVDVADLHEEMDRAEVANSSEEKSQTLEETIQKLTNVHAVASSDAPIISQDLQAALNEFIQKTQTVGFNGDVSELHHPLTSWLSVATTVMSEEVVCRLNNSPILDKNPIRVSAALDGVVRAAFAMSATSSEESLSEVRNHAWKLLSSLVGEDADDRTDTILNSNIFSVFVSLWLSSTVLRKSKQMSDIAVLKNNVGFEKNMLYFCTLAQVVQIFLFLDVDKLVGISDNVTRYPSKETAPMRHACNQIRVGADLPQLPSTISDDRLVSVVDESLEPYIRCCALFLHHVTGVPASESPENTNEQAELIRYLGLPKNLTELFDVGGKLSLEPLIQKWICHPAVKSRAASLPHYLSYPTVSKVPDIVPFPYDYSDLIGAAASFRCPKFASEDSLYPTMCLVCGVILCSQSYCCQQALPEKEQQVGACTFHARSCGASSGMFLRVREAAIVLLNGVYRGCFIHAPYLDKHGEADKGLRRGHPLYLNQPRLTELRKLWLSHGIPERVSHDMESRHLGQILDWAHL